MKINVFCPFGSYLKQINWPHSQPNQCHILHCLTGIGFIVYYLSNSQKDGFRKNPNDPAFARMYCTSVIQTSVRTSSGSRNTCLPHTDLETLCSPSGRKLLVSGWFGWVRHPNYSGDILMTLAWCLPCGETLYWFLTSGLCHHCTT